MNFADAIHSSLLQNYMNFSGRAKRSEFWYFQVFMLLLGIIFSATFDNARLDIIVALALFVPAFANFCRRLNDIGITKIIALPYIYLAVYFILLSLGYASIPGGKFASWVQDNLHMEVFDVFTVIYFSYFLFGLSPSRS